MSSPSIHQRRALAEALEVPDCDCDPALGACPHTRSVNHALSLPEWAALLRAAYPDGRYNDPPPAHRPVKVLTRAARLAVLENRAADGVSLWHAEDLIVMEDAEDELHIAPVAENEANGALQHHSRIVDSEYQGTRQRTRTRDA